MAFVKFDNRLTMGPPSQKKLWDRGRLPVIILNNLFADISDDLIPAGSKCVELFFDPENYLIGFRFWKYAVTGAFKICDHRKYHDRRYVSIEGLLAEYHIVIPPGETINYNADEVGNDANLFLISL
jgi:hypothetical protein